MDFLKFFTKPAAVLRALPTGSFTVDPDAKIIASTLPYHFPTEFAEDIGMQVLKAFKEASMASLPAQELVVRFASLKVTARALRGGAIIFLSPQTLTSQFR